MVIRISFDSFIAILSLQKIFQCVEYIVKSISPLIGDTILGVF